jgi:hypothetical protein
MSEYAVAVEMKDFWIVCEAVMAGASMTGIAVHVQPRYDSFASATRAAQNLADKDPGKIFVVMESSCAFVNGQQPGKAQ